MVLFLHSAGISLEGLAQYDDRTLHVFLLQYVGDSYLVAAGTGGDVEAAGRCHHDCLALVAERRETPAAELVGIVYRQLRHGIEGSHRCGREYSGDVV